MAGREPEREESFKSSIALPNTSKAITMIFDMCAKNPEVHVDGIDETDDR